MLFLTVALCLFCGARATRPHIILIVADDLGWNDVSFHGSGQIPTPNIDALAASGLMLHNYYVSPICTPSRATLMTGKYAIHTGMQHTVLFGAEPRGLPLSERLLPQYLQELGYRTHLVGKWHLGSYKREYLPLNRGFESHLGFWTGKIDMYDHTSQEKGSWGFDFRRGYEVAHDLFGLYATDIYTDESIKIIKAHNESEPLFLMVAHSAVHSGNPSEPLRAPDDLIANCSHIANRQRQKFAAMVHKLDESVGRVVAALQEAGLLQRSVLLFTTDNGGPAAGFNSNAASNFPLRGVKNTLWEGGVRGAGALWSPLLARRARVATQRLHIADWLPTLLSVAGYTGSLPQLDGVDMWRALSEDLPSPRTSLVHNIDDEYGNAAITVDQWKLLKGSSYNGAWDFWYGPSGREEPYEPRLLRRSAAGRALLGLDMLPSDEKIMQLREFWAAGFTFFEATTLVLKGSNASVADLGVAGTVQCGAHEPAACRPLLAPCLFDIAADPCETRNLADKEPEVLRRLLAELARVNGTARPPGNRPLEPRGDPRRWGRLYTTWGDFLPPPAPAPRRLPLFNGFFDFLEPSY